METDFDADKVNSDTSDTGTLIGCLMKLAAHAVFVLFVLTAATVAQEKNSFLRTVTIEENPYTGSVNCFGCSVIVKGELNGEIVTIGGNVTVYGKVRKDIVAVGGAVHLKNGAEVDEDAVAIGGEITTEGVVIAPARDGFASLPWIHFPGQLSVGWRGALALLGFHVVCVLLPVLLLRPRRVRNAALAARRWLITGLLGAAAIAGLSFLLDLIDEHVHPPDTVETVVSVLFLAILALGLAGIILAIGERFFPNRLFVALLAGGVFLVILELLPYAGFVVMILGSCWATGAALWSGMGFRGPHSTENKEVPAVLKLTP
jgi:hypothetical protein